VREEKTFETRRHARTAVAAVHMRLLQIPKERCRQSLMPVQLPEVRVGLCILLQCGAHVSASVSVSLCNNLALRPPCVTSASRGMGWAGADHETCRHCSASCVAALRGDRWLAFAAVCTGRRLLEFQTSRVARAQNFDFYGDILFTAGSACNSYGLLPLICWRRELVLHTSGAVQWSWRRSGWCS
jgi:hypothetical protein